MLGRNVWVVSLALALGSMNGSASFAATAAGAGYWHTSGSKILDSNNQQVRIAGINWYGFETTDEVAHGLTSQDYKTILQTIQSNGYNTIRLPFSNQMVETPIVPTAIQYSGVSGPINTDLKGLNSLQVMDAIVAYAGQIGLRVILDDHRSEAGNSAEASGLWYTSAYPETAWISDWQTLVTRYQGDTTVIGVDLRNEPHNANSGGACWDCVTPANDWHLAAERAGNAVLAINSKLLVFVEGTDEYKNNYYFWGGNLMGVQTSPVQLTVTNQLVYSAHDYGPLESSQAWFNGSTSYDSLVSTWTSYWAYISLNGIAPVWVGEFGTLNDDADIQGSTPGSEGQWFSSLVQFLGANPALNWTYWALNGEDRYGLLDSTYDATPVSALKQQLLAGLQFPLSGGTPVTTPTFTLAQSPATVVAGASNTDAGSSGNVTEVTYTAMVANRTTTDESSVSITLTLPAAGVVITEAGTGAASTCSTGSTGYTCSFGTIAASSSGGVSVTAIYPAANVTFGGSGQVSEVVNATAEVGSQALTPASVTTTVDQSNQQNASESVVATPNPGSSYTYGQAATVNFTLSPVPTTPIPLTSLTAQLDGTQNLTITSTGTNQYQIAVGVLTGGSHTVSIHLAASSSYAAASDSVALAVQKAPVTAAVAGAPLTGSYGTAIPISIGVTGLSGNGLAAPSGTVTLVIDSQAPVTAALSGGTAGFTAAAGLAASTHALIFNYSGDSNYAAQNQGASLLVKQAPLIATAAPVSRAYGAGNPILTGTLIGVVNNDGITATWVTQATTTTAAGVYTSGPDAITPVLVDPNNRLSNYAVTLNDGTLTIGAGNADINWPTPNAIDYGTPLNGAQLDAVSTLSGTFTYKPPAGTVLGAGTQTLSVSFLPTGSTTVQTASATLQVNPASTQTILTGVNATVAGSVTLSATVISQQGGTVTGSVQFLDGSTSIATVSVNATGLASYSVLLSNGPHTLTAVYSGDVNNLTSVSTAVLESVVGGLDFSLSANPKMLSMNAGQSTPVQLSVFSSDGFTGVVTFKCTGLPNGSTCSFNPATVTGSANSTAETTTVTIGLPSASSAIVPAADGRYLAGFLAVPGGLLGLFLLWQRKKLQRTLGMWILTAVFLTSVAVGCGVSSSVPKSSSPGGNSTTVGTYDAVITATSPATVQTLTIPVTLTQ